MRPYRKHGGAKKGMKAIRLLAILICGVLFIGQANGRRQGPDKARDIIVPDTIAVADTIAIMDTIVAPDTLMPAERVVEIMLPEYPEWERATINGKLKMKGLPLSPSIRIFMEKDSLVELSIKAPFMGEVGRVIITPDTLLGVNKMNKTYTKLAINEILRYYPGGIREIQSLLLGRVVMPGLGEINEEILGMVNFLETDMGLAIIPAEGYGVEGFDYGYVTDEGLNPLALIVMPEFAENTSVSVAYDYEKDGVTETISYLQNDKGMTFELQMKNPEWTGEAAKPINMDKKYVELPIRDFVNSFGR